jgi:co-chaperonin GroES (HSP10)
MTRLEHPEEYHPAIFSMLNLTNLKTINDVILVEADSRELLENGLYQPSQAQHPDHAERFAMQRYGTVRVVGPGLKHKKSGIRMPMALHVGDRVLFRDWVGIRHPKAPWQAAVENDLIFMREQDVEAVQLQKAA